MIETVPLPERTFILPSRLLLGAGDDVRIGFRTSSGGIIIEGRILNKLFEEKDKYQQIMEDLEITLYPK